MSDSLLRVGNDFSKDLSEKYHTTVYDYRDKNFYMVIRGLSVPWRKNTDNLRECYSLISNENTNVFNEKYLYGYNEIDIKLIMHHFEADSYSADIENSTEYINRIMIPKEIVTSHGSYSELQIRNKKNYSDNSYISLKPSYIIAIDEIEPYIIDESQRLGIPIILIKNKDLILKSSSYIDELSYKYADSSYRENERSQKR